jgi:hypothetical protein
VEFSVYVYVPHLSQKRFQDLPPSAEYLTYALQQKLAVGSTFVKSTQSRPPTLTKLCPGAASALPVPILGKAHSTPIGLSQPGVVTSTTAENLFPAATLTGEDSFTVTNPAHCAVPDVSCDAAPVSGLSAAQST